MSADETVAPEGADTAGRFPWLGMAAPRERRIEAGRPWRRTPDRVAAIRYNALHWLVFARGYAWEGVCPAVLGLVPGDQDQIRELGRVMLSAGFDPATARTALCLDDGARAPKMEAA